MDCDTIIGIDKNFDCILKIPPPIRPKRKKPIKKIPSIDAINCCAVNQPKSLGPWYCLLQQTCQPLDCSNALTIGVDS